MSRMPVASFTIPASRVQSFRLSHDPRSALRVGQAFHIFAQLYKMHQDRVFCDQLWEADGEVAWAMIESITDHQN